MSPVMPMLACPSTSETTLSGTPLTSITAAAEWRSVCKLMSGRPACLAAVWRARRALRGSYGVPSSVVNT